MGPFVTLTIFGLGVICGMVIQENRDRVRIVEAEKKSSWG